MKKLLLKKSGFFYFQEFRSFFTIQDLYYNLEKRDFVVLDPTYLNGIKVEFSLLKRSLN